MEHSFNVKMATELGILPAVLMREILMEHMQEAARGSGNGKVLLWGNLTGLYNFHPYAKPAEIKAAWDKLLDSHLIEVVERTTDDAVWFTVTPAGFDSMR